jgi:hypothetical protein
MVFLCNVYLLYLDDGIAKLKFKLNEIEREIMKAVEGTKNDKEQ